MLKKKSVIAMTMFWYLTTNCHKSALTNCDEAYITLA